MSEIGILQQLMKGALQKECLAEGPKCIIGTRS